MSCDVAKQEQKKAKMGQEVILKTKEEKDLGVVIQDTLSPEQHINQLFGSTYRTLSNIRVTFYYMDKDMIKNSNQYDKSQVGICCCGVVT